METKRPCIRVRACRHVSAPDPPRGGVPIPSLGEGSGYYSGGPDFHGRSGTPGCSAERLLLPEHVVLPDLSQPGDGSGTVVGRTGLPVRRGPAAGRS